MPINRLKDFLDEHRVKFATIRHSEAYTAQEVAESAHIPGKDLAKTVIIKINGKMAMAVLPAPYRVNLDVLKEAIGANNIELAREEEFSGMFPDCEVGAIPPFGNLYDMDVFVAESLAEDEEICFNAGSHWELIELTYRDFEKLVKPKVVKFALKP